MEIDSVGSANNLPIHGICQNGCLIMCVGDVAVTMIPAIDDIYECDDKCAEPHDDWFWRW
jgi:hypothetical protein